MAERDWITEEEFEVAVAYLRVLLLTNVGRDRQRIQPKVLEGNPLNRGYLPASLDWRPPYLTIRNAFRLADRPPRDQDFSTASYDVDSLSDLSTGTYGVLFPSGTHGRGGSIFFVPVGLLGRVLCALEAEYGYTPSKGGVTEIPSWEECQRKVGTTITRLNLKDWGSLDAAQAKELGEYPVWGDYSSPRKAIERQERLEHQKKVAVLVPPLPKREWFFHKPESEPAKSEPAKSEPDSNRRNLWGWLLVVVATLAFAGCCYTYATTSMFDPVRETVFTISTAVCGVCLTLYRFFCDDQDE